jgi:hypothetical protein
MQRLIILILFLLINCNISYALQGRIDAFKRGLNPLLGVINNASEVFIITVSRSNREKISEAKLEKVLNILRKMCGHVESANNQAPPIVTNICPLNHAKIIVFNEMFFYKAKPLDQADYNTMMQSIHDFSAIDSKMLIYANFLHVTNEYSVDLAEYSTLITSRLDSSKMVFDDVILGVAEREKKEKEEEKIMTDALNIRTHGSHAPTFMIKCLLNETFCIRNNQELTKYKKSSYFKEADAVLKQRRVFYGYGDNKDCIVTAGLLSNFLVENISTQICLDLNVNTRNSNAVTPWIENTANPSVVHIIQSNCIDPASYKNANNLPKDKLVIHVDAIWNNGSSFKKLKDTIIKSDNSDLGVNNVSFVEQYNLRIKGDAEPIAAEEDISFNIYKII